MLTLSVFLQRCLILMWNDWQNILNARKCFPIEYVLGAIIIGNGKCGKFNGTIGMFLALETP